MPRAKKGKKVTRRRRRPAKGGGKHITKVCIQTSKDPIPEYVVTQLKKNLSGWEYKYFTDTDILTFFKEHPLPEFPQITEKFHGFSAGPHKADLFRYYYLYIKGGLFIDSDLMLYDTIDSILGNNQFVSVWAIKPTGSAFNGFLAASPEHPILYSALKDLYNIKNEDLVANYSLVVSHLGDIIHANSQSNVKMLQETLNNDVFCYIEDTDTHKVKLIHYQSTEIPNI